MRNPGRCDVDIAWPAEPETTEAALQVLAAEMMFMAHDLTWLARSGQVALDDAFAREAAELTGAPKRFAARALDAEVDPA